MIPLPHQAQLVAQALAIEAVVERRMLAPGLRPLERRHLSERLALARRQAGLSTEPSTETVGDE